MNFKSINLSENHLASVKHILQENGLPFLDCRDHLKNFIGVELDNNLIAIGGFQVAGEYALLRSIAVHHEYKRQGIGADIVREILRRLQSSGVSQLYLLTEEAVAYFERFGFAPVSRDTVPDEIKQTQQFSSLCPASAQTMLLIQ